jgi:hypothetical protein
MKLLSVLALLFLPVLSWADCNVNTQTNISSYTTVLRDANNCVAMNNAGTNTVTIPLNATVPYPVRTTVTIQNVGAGVTTVSVLGTLNTYVGAPSTLNPYERMTLRQTSLDVWYLESLTVSGGGASGVNITPDTHPFTPTAFDDEFEETSLPGKWSLLNTGTSTVSLANGSLVITGNNGSADHAFVVSESIASIVGTYDFRAKVALGHGVAEDCRVGIYAGLGTALTAAVLFGVYSVTPALYVSSYTNLNTHNATLAIPALVNTLGLTGGPWMYLDLNYDGTNLNFNASATGVTGSFVNVFSGTPAAILGAAPTAAGVFTDCGNPGLPMVVDWFRRVS